MANFNEALDVLLSWEGGYSCDPRDPGGETYCGISRKHWPNWIGWKAIDILKWTDFSNGKIKWNTKFPELNSDVAAFYFENFWSIYYEQINDQDVCNKLFQHNVNMGDRAIAIAQKVIGFYITSQDGRLGPATIAALNAYSETKTSIEFLGSYITALELYYEQLISEHPQLHVFENEWMLRAKTIGKRPN